MNNETDLMRVYLNYLFALNERKMYGDRYGDTNLLIKMYEEYINNQIIEKKSKEKIKK